MAEATYEGVNISGLACAVPKNIEYARDYADKFDVEKFISTVGVEEHRLVSEGQCASDLCYVAAENLIAHKGYDQDSFDGIILVTECPDYAIPATAHVLHKRLGLSKDCLAFDINLGCSGFVYGVSVAASMIRSGLAKRILLCCGYIHINDYLIPKQDYSMQLLFGDAGSALVLEKGDDCIHSLLKADGSGYDTIIFPGYHDRINKDYSKLEHDSIIYKMDGASTFEFAIKSEPKIIMEYLNLFGETLDDYDYYVFHQANRLILKHVCKKLHIPNEKVPISIDRYGNTGTVSIPLTIADMVRNMTKEEYRLVASGFGAGLSWGVVGFSLKKNDILPIIETDDYYHEAYKG